MRTGPKEFPFRILTLALVLTVGVLAFPGWQIWQAFKDYQNHAQRQPYLREALESLQNLDILLSTQARIFIQSKDEEWERSYLQADIKFHKALILAESIGPDLFVTDAKSLQIFHRPIGPQEKQAMVLLKQGHPEAASQLLDSADYNKQQQKFSRLIRQTRSRLAFEQQQEIEWQWQRMTGALLVLMAGVPALLLIWLRVISLMREYLLELAKLELALSHERHLLTALLDTMPDRIYFKDRQSRFIRCSWEMLRRLGVQRHEEVIGKNDFDFHPAERAHEFAEDERRVMETGQPIINKVERQTNQTGDTTWALVSKASLQDSSGRVTGLIGISRDITALKAAELELRESEELNRTLISSLPQRIFFKDRELVFLGANEAFAGDLGKKPAEIVGKTDFDFFPKELADKYRMDDMRVMAHRKPVTIEEKNLIHGQERVVEVVKAPVINDEGEVIGLVGLFTDITERKLAEQKLRQFTSQLEQNNRELQEFAYVASHDLQEPLRKVRAFGDRLKAKCADAFTPEGKDYLERMQNAAGRMQNLIDALLSYSRVSTRAQPFVLVDLNEVIKGVLEDLELAIERTKGRVEAGPLPTLEADPMQMRQLLQNLIGNALKFHQPQDVPVIQVRSQTFVADATMGERFLAGRSYCRIEVADNGIGFDEKYLNRIFVVFQRLHGRGEYEGSGVGLAICRKIALRHQGDITAHSQPGAGATFIITLPLKQV
ncbi:MAG: PAS domain-containing protein [Verrucomicrobiota bacterium]